MTHEEFKLHILPLQNAMYRMALSVALSEADAADIVQDTMLKLYRSRSDIASMENVRGYCMRATRNECVAWLARRRETLDIESAGGVESGGRTDDRAEYTDSVEAVSRVIDSLPEMQAKVIRMSAFGGFDTSEIVEATGCSESNVRQILSRVRKRLRLILKSY